MRIHDRMSSRLSSLKLIVMAFGIEVDRLVGFQDTENHKKKISPYFEIT